MGNCTLQIAFNTNFVGAFELQPDLHITLVNWGLKREEIMLLVATMHSLAHFKACFTVQMLSAITSHLYWVIHDGQK